MRLKLMILAKVMRTIFSLFKIKFRSFYGLNARDNFLHPKISLEITHIHCMLYTVECNDDFSCDIKTLLFVIYMLKGLIESFFETKNVNSRNYSNSNI